ncbi:hypothetical protein [Halobaculum sp. MBLA0143]|uniref:hypothetical protein n=1 Tax=Halobaculum sp. MBLA0143 TaxID=3079933 RepID=UPI0035267015
MKSPYYIDREANAAVASTKKALEHALYKAGVSLDIPEEYTGVTGFYADNIRVNKLAYAVIDKYDLSAVRTWYKYGQYEPYEELRAGKLEVGPINNLGEYVHSRQKQDLQVGDLVNALLEFNLAELFQMDTYEFLRTNYRGFAPDGVEQVYLASTEIIRVLQEAAEAAEEEIRSRVLEWREQIQEAALDIEYATGAIDYLPAYAAERLNWFVDTLADLLISIECSGGPLTSATDHLERARDYYHQTFWPITAMSISIEEVEGPDAERYRNKGRGIRSQLKSDSETEKTNWETDLTDDRLTPTVSERQSVVMEDGMGSQMFDASVRLSDGD